MVGVIRFDPTTWCIEREFGVLVEYAQSALVQSKDQCKHTANNGDGQQIQQQLR